MNTPSSFVTGFLFSTVLLAGVSQCKGRGAGAGDRKAADSVIAAAHAGGRESRDGMSRGDSGEVRNPVAGEAVTDSGAATDRGTVKDRSAATGSGPTKEGMDEGGITEEQKKAFAKGPVYANRTPRPLKYSLPECCTVLLSPQTVLHISEKPGKAGRELQLDGEAFFTVDARRAKPFIIYTRNLVIQCDPGKGQQAAGGRFRIDAYMKNAGEQVDLLSGRLKVRKTYHSDTDNNPEVLQSGDMVMINRDIDLMEKEKLEVGELKKLEGREW